MFKSLALLIAAFMAPQMTWADVNPYLTNDIAADSWPLASNYASVNTRRQSVSRQGVVGLLQALGPQTALLIPASILPAVGNYVYASAQVTDINQRLDGHGSRITNNEKKISTLEGTVSTQGSSSGAVCTQLKNILDEAALGTLTVAGADTAALVTSVNTELAKVTAKVDAIIDGTITCT